MSGSAIVTVLGFLLTPILSRIYSPAAYGQFAVFNSVIGNLNLLATLAYTSAIPLPRTRKEALTVVQLNVVLTIGMFGLVTLVLVLVGGHLVRWLNLQSLGAWIYLMPLLTLVYSLSLIMSSWYIRTKSFRTRTTADLVMSIASRTFTLGYGWLSGGHSSGFILGDSLGKVTLFMSLLRSGFHQELRALLRTFSWPRIRQAVYQYREFPLYVLPGGYVGSLSSQLPIFMLTSAFGSTVVGLYSFAASLLEIPVGLIGSGIAPVFYQKATEVHHTDPDRLKDITLSIYYKLLYIGLLPLGFITVFGDLIFKYVFGAEWMMAGVFTGYLGYYYIFRITGQATGAIYNVLQRQRFALLTNILLLITRGAGLAVGIWMKDVNMSMLLFGIASLVSSFLIDLHILHLLRLPVFRIALRTIFLMGATLSAFYLLRLGLEQSSAELLSK